MLVLEPFEVCWLKLKAVDQLGSFSSCFKLTVRIPLRVKIGALLKVKETKFFNKERQILSNFINFIKENLSNLLC